MSYAVLPAGVILQATRRVKTSVSIPIGAGGALLSSGNPNRIGFIIYNNSGNTIYVEYNTTASSATPEHLIATFTSLAILGPVVWTGALAAVRNAGSGTAILTELFSY